MARAAGVSVENNFKNGHITEATGLNFPENACIDSMDCVFTQNGSVTRRFGFDFETDWEIKEIDRANKTVNGYLWENVAGDGSVTLYVVQIGDTLYFWKPTAIGISQGALATTVDLNTFVTGTNDAGLNDCQFSNGGGVLFVTHPLCETFYVEYDPTTETVSATEITLKIRDFEGDPEDPHDTQVRPTNTLADLNVHHKYNLYNQGWTTVNLNTWDAATTVMPSNADVMWRFKNSSDAFDMATVVNVDTGGGNSPAPRGHFILDLHSQARSNVAGIAGVTDKNTGDQRCSTSAFFAGRVFYSGLNYSEFNSSIYFTQVIENADQYEKCYQQNDPTSEDLFDLLPTDGGVIDVKEAGTIYKLISVINGLLIHAANGIWFLSGSSGLGFTANDYSLTKISSTKTLSASSFVDIGGYPCWWNAEGIYVISADQGGPTAQIITREKIQNLYDGIPINSKAQAKGYYDPISGVVQWLYRHDATLHPTVRNNFTHVLNLNTRTGAFYLWAIPDHDVTVNAIFASESTQEIVYYDGVVDNDDEVVIDNDGEIVLGFTNTSLRTALPTFKYLVSYQDETLAWQFTIAETNNQDYVDWESYDDTGVSYESYFITGFKIRGEGIRKFQNNFLNIFSKTSNIVTYYIQGLWDYAIAGDTGRWSSKQKISHLDTSYSNSFKRIKIRGSGKVLQFKISSFNNEGFEIIGWSELSSANALP